MIVIGGSNSEGELSDVEVIDLENPYSTCSLIPDYPNDDGGMVVGFFNWTIKACGNIDDIDSCYDYDPSTNSWTTSASLLYPRRVPKASFIDGTWLVSGDDDDPSNGITDMWNGNGFIQGPSLPEPMAYHCQLTVNSSHVFFANPSDGATFLLNWETQNWSVLPFMSYTRTYPSCGMIQNPENGLEAVMVGVDRRCLLIQA